MVTASKPAPSALFLEDLHAGQRSSSGSHTIDEAQIKEFAGQFVRVGFLGLSFRTRLRAWTSGSRPGPGRIAVSAGQHCGL
jgi:hypothetical protein